jgi:nicotinamide phosphoribosyltransferase
MSMKSAIAEYCDSYKLAHWEQYPEGTEYVYSNFTPRRGRIDGTGVIFFGLQAFLKKMTETFSKEFFNVPENVAVDGFRNFCKSFFGEFPERSVERVRELHRYKRIPLEIKALREGAFVPYGVPCLTIVNTDSRFFWFTNFIESWLSAEIWASCTTATMAYKYKKLFAEYASKTSDDDWFVDFQGHDFSFRGLMGVEAARTVGMAHLTSFKGTDCLPAINHVRSNYPVQAGTMIGTSVPATEHSVMCAGGEEDERETIKRLITEVHPTGIVSIVSDTWDFWKTVTETYPSLKEEIMAREGKVVIRPDSSPLTPVEIVCGDPFAESGTPESKGLIECLWESFGGTTNSKGYKVLDPHIGAIYGDSITLEYAEAILKKLENRGFASTNIVFGIGSYTYQFVTRDTHSFAMKATAVCINGEWKSIFKDPKTDNSGKKSARGWLRVEHKSDGTKFLIESEPEGELKLHNSGYLRTVFREVPEHGTGASFQEVRSMINANIGMGFV